VARKRTRQRTRKSRSPRTRAGAEVNLKDHLIEMNFGEDARTIHAETAPPPAGGRTEAWRPPLLPRETRGVLAQAMFLFSASSLRHYAGLLDTLGRHVPNLGRALEGGETNDAEGAEQLRACLRELADHSIEETRRLRAQLDRLDPSAAEPSAEPTGPYWRRWEAKP
jgi:hypothetical protein